MWVEELTNGKYKYVERYIEPYTEKLKTSITLNKNTAQAKNRRSHCFKKK